MFYCLTRVRNSKTLCKCNSANITHPFFDLGYKSTLFCIVIILLSSCRSANNYGINSSDDNSSMLELANSVQTTYDDYILENYKLARRISCKNLLREKKINRGGTNSFKLLLVTTNMDCSSCIDAQFAEMMDSFSYEELKEHMVLITTEENNIHLQNKWPRILKYLSVIILDKETLAGEYHYEPSKPMYILTDSNGQQVYETFIIDIRFHILSLHYLRSFSKKENV
jgi:hypothetical protein